MKKNILVTRSSMPPIDEYVAEISDLWDSHWLTNMGEKHRRFEEMLKQYFGVDNLALFTNGHSALESIIETLNLRGKVITTPFTFASTTHAIIRCGLTPVFSDIKEGDYTIDPGCIEKLIDDDTCAIMPVHVYGNMCDTQAIEDIANKYGLKVIYDAAHAFGVVKEGKTAASFGDASMFSFHATKVFHSIEGGAVCFSDSALMERLNQVKNFGYSSSGSVEIAGGNSKMNEFCAAMGICNLRHINEEIGKRKRVVERYRDNLSEVHGIRFCPPQDGVDSNYSYFPIRVIPGEYGATRDDVFAALGKRGFGARKYFYPLTCDFECYSGMFDDAIVPVARTAADSVLTLPLFADLGLDDVDEICSIIKRCES